MSALTNQKVYKSIKKYGCGNVRSLQDFDNFVGIDRKTKTIGKPQVEFFKFEKQDTKSDNLIFLLLILLFLILFLLCKR